MFTEIKGKKIIDQKVWEKSDKNIYFHTKEKVYNTKEAKYLQQPTPQREGKRLLDYYNKCENRYLFVKNITSSYKNEKKNRYSYKQLK